MKIRRNTRLDRILFCPENRIQRDAQIWHTVFSMLTAVQSTLLLFILARVCGSGDAGIFSLAISVGYLMIMIGNYGVRNYQVTDIVPVYGFREYRTHRWTTCLIMTAVSLGYVLLRGYETEKALSVFLVCVLKVIESVENVYHAEYQRVNRLDTASKIGTIRISTTTLAFVAAILITRSLWISILVMDLAAAGFLPDSLIQTALAQLRIKTDDLALAHSEIDTNTVEPYTALHLIAIHLFAVNSVQRIVQQLLGPDTRHGNQSC